jgi:hypothetical protein
MNIIIKEMGFCGNLQWILNEEGSGAKFYRSSAYYPDNRANPVTSSGVTIDPGVDLGNGDRDMIDDVLEYYLRIGLLDGVQNALLRQAIGLKKFNAIDWINENEKHFKNKFLVKTDTAEIVAGRYSAVNYWRYLVDKLPELLQINLPFMAPSVHTALLSLAYNWGMSRTVDLVAYPIKTRNYSELSARILTVKHNSRALNERREREAELIYTAAAKGKEFAIDINENLNPEPLTVIPIGLHDNLKMNFVSVGEKPMILG